MLVAAFAVAPALQAQIDPVKRDLVQVGYNAALEGHPPLSAYVFLYHNQPGFLQTNLTLRLSIAPTYLDSELGIRGALGANTDVGLGLAGGGFADNYTEIRQGTFLTRESFDGFGGELSGSLYHLFNPGSQIPLNGVLRAVGHYSTYANAEETAQGFTLPEAHTTFSVRTGLRWGGREPTLYPALAMELSIWYEGQYRTASGLYGFEDRSLHEYTHLFWGEAFLAYELPKSKQSFSVSLTAGGSLNADRLSAYRLGALLPLSSEFPLSLPGYFYQEISAREFILLGGNYLVPLDGKQRWNVNLTGAGGVVNYLEGLEQPGNWHSGVGAGILYRSASLKIMVGYAYGVEAIRSHGRGANSIGVLLQLDWEQARERFPTPANPLRWRGFQQFLGWLGL